MGNPIEHSLSPIIHQHFAKTIGCELRFEKILIDLAQFEDQVHTFFNSGGRGLSITLPCKTRAFSISDVKTERCIIAGAANTLWLKENKLYADNTDGIGLLRDLTRYIELNNKHILLLGAGGAAQGIIGPLLSTNPTQLTVINRTINKANILQLQFPGIKVGSFEDLVQDKPPYDIIINATSASLTKTPLLLPPSLMAKKPFCYDLAYQKGKPTSFVAQARSFGCQAVDGIGMLVEQAGEAFFIWHSVRPNTASVLAALTK